MMMASRQAKTILVHLGVWVIVLLSRTYIFNIMAADKLLLLDYALYAVYFYLNALWITPALFSSKKLYFIIINLLLIGCLSTVEAYATIEVFGDNISIPIPEGGSGSYNVRNSFSLQFMTAVYFNSYVFLISFAYSAIKLSLRHEREKEELITSQLSTKLSRMRSQVNPELLSFLLKRMDQSLEHKPQEEVATAIEDLSGLMRYMIYRKGDKKVSLVQELEKAHCLIALLRSGASETDISPLSEDRARELLIEPTILISLVETAYMINQNQMVTEISNLRLDEGSLQVSMPIIEQATQDYESKLAKIRERLEVAYPETHRLNIDRKRNNITLTLQLI